MAVLSLPLYVQRILPAINTLVVSLLVKSSAPQDMAHRMHRPQRRKLKSTVVGCGEKEHTERHRNVRPPSFSSRRRIYETASVQSRQPFKPAPGSGVGNRTDRPCAREHSFQLRGWEQNTSSWNV